MAAPASSCSTWRAKRWLPTYISDWPRRDPGLASLHDHPEFIRLFGRAEKA